MKKLILLKKIVIILAVLTLIGAWFYANNTLKNQNKAEDSITKNSEVLKQALPQAAAFDEINSQPLTFSARDSAQKIIGYVALAEANGYGGPLKVAVGIDLTGQILSTVIVEDKETPSYLQEVINQNYLANFQRTNIINPYVLGVDLDGVSGATITSQAIAKAVRIAAHSVGKEQLKLKVEEIGDPWVWGLAEVSVLILFTGAIVFSLIWKKPKLRIPLIAISIFILGFWLNRPLSLSYLTSAILGFFPSPRENLLWYIILFTGLGLPLLTGRNIYCFWLCPFGGLQEIINKLCGVKYRLKISKYFKLTRYFLLWLGIMLALLSANPAMSNIEPFSTVFSFLGTKLDWIKLVVVLIIGVFSYRFWCTFLCPIGALLDSLKIVHSKTRELAAKSNHLNSFCKYFKKNSP